jgi:hypothetical protein
MLPMLEFFGCIAGLVGTPVSRCFRALCIDNKRIQHVSGSLLIWFDRYKVYCAPYQIWIKVIHLILKKYDNLFPKLHF